MDIDHGTVVTRKHLPKPTLSMWPKSLVFKQGLGISFGGGKGWEETSEGSPNTPRIQQGNDGKRLRNVSGKHNFLR